MHSNNPKNQKIILASGSPRRQQFFKDLGWEIEIRLKPIVEEFPPNLNNVEITDYLAQLKSTPFLDGLNAGEILITSDTIVWHNFKALGKPNNSEEAFKMIKSLSDSTHEVITSVCFTTLNFQETINCTTNVTFKEFSDEEITYYVETFKPFDKAGAYGIQEWLGLIGVTKIEGSYFNVMGLPTHLVYETLNKILQH